jgi:hypothetical protein
VTPEQVFAIVNLVAIVGWIMLVVMPHQRWVVTVVTSVLLPAFFAVVYVAIVSTTLGRTPGNFSTLDGVATLFSNPWVLLAGWVHYLAFDLFVGSWEVRDARERGVPHLLVVPCLVLTFLLGPAGWLLYLVLRSLHARSQTPIAVTS